MPQLQRLDIDGEVQSTNNWGAVLAELHSLQEVHLYKRFQ
jgi:hypothetical protein